MVLHKTTPVQKVVLCMLISFVVRLLGIHQAEAARTSLDAVLLRFGAFVMLEVTSKH